MGRPYDFDCQEAIAIGSRWELVSLATEEGQQMAYRRRIQWMYWLKKIAERPTASERAELLLSSFDAFFAPEAIAALPTEVLAKLVGVFPQTMERIHEQHYHDLGITIPSESGCGEHWSYVQFQYQSPPERQPVESGQNVTHFFFSRPPVSLIAL